MPGLAIINAVTSMINFVDNCFQGKAQVSGQISIRATEGKLYGSISFSTDGVSARSYDQLSDMVSQLEAIAGSPVRTSYDDKGRISGVDFHIPVGDVGLATVSAIIGGYCDIETSDFTAVIGAKASTREFLGGFTLTAKLKIKAPTIGKLPTVQGGNFADIFLDDASKKAFNDIWGD